MLWTRSTSWSKTRLVPVNGGQPILSKQWLPGFGTPLSLLRGADWWSVTLRVSRLVQFSLWRDNTTRPRFSLRGRMFTWTWPKPSTAHPKGTLTKADVEKRQIGKNTVLGCGFQMGWEKFHAKYCPDHPPEFAQQIINAYRKSWAPGVPKLWAALEEDALRVVCGAKSREPYGIRYEMEDGWLTARLLDGKKIYYWNPRRATRDRCRGMRSADRRTAGPTRRPSKAS